MASTLSGLLDTLLADFARPDGSAPYVYDLSSTDRVKLGEYGRPWLTAAPCACLFVSDVTSGFSAELGRYSRSVALTWRAWAPLTADDPELGEKAAADLLSDILTAVEVSRKKGIGATLMLASGATFVGPAQGSGGMYAQAGGSIALTYRLTTGA